METPSPFEPGPPTEPGAPRGDPWERTGDWSPEPDEVPPPDLWSVVGDVRPWGTRAILLAWVVLYAVVALRRELGDPAALLLWGASATGLPARDAAWRLLASTFLHGGIAHLFFNALTLIVLGPAVERIFARSGFWIVYAGGGAAASLASLLWRAAREPGALSLSVGGSGAIFAMGGALLAGAVRLRGRLATGRARALAAALLFLVLQSLAGGATRIGTDNVAHLAGLASGLLLGTAIPLEPRLGGGRAGWVRALGVLAAALVAVSVAWAVRSGLRLG